MKEVKFNQSGGPVVAEIRCGHAQPGSYSFTLWEANENKKVMREAGNFLNPDDDAYELPAPVDDNHDRIVEFLGNVVITPPIQDYQVDVIISQDGAELGRDTDKGKASGTKPFDLFLILKRGG